MPALAVCVFILAYLSAGLIVARFAYGWMRAKSIDGNRSRYPNLYPTTEKAVKEWNYVDRVPAMLAAFLVLALWPAVVLVPPVLWFARFLDKAPRLSQSEYRDRLGERERRIAELEKEAGIR